MKQIDTICVQNAEISNTADSKTFRYCCALNGLLKLVDSAMSVVHIFECKCKPHCISFFGHLGCR